MQHCLSSFLVEPCHLALRKSLKLFIQLTSNLNTLFLIKLSKQNFKEKGNCSLPILILYYLKKINNFVINSSSVKLIIMHSIILLLDCYCNIKPHKLYT